MLKDNNNNWIEEGEEIKSMFQTHFKNIFTTEIYTSNWIQIVKRFPKLNNCATRFLSSELQNFKAKQALLDMAS